MVITVKKSKRNLGLTIVEMMTVVAILTILMGVSAVAIIEHQRNLHMKEMDSIAKEIFIAAQNHLSAAKSQNLLTDYATQDNGSGLGYAADGNTNYIICNGGHVETPSALNQILPFGSIDETTRGNGSFILHYNKQTARVLDVFYATKTGSRYGHSLRTSDYSELMEEEYHGDTSNQREKRKRYSKNGARNAVVGWYGGDDLGSTILNYLEEPIIQVENGDRLTVKVSNFAAKTGKTLSTDSCLSLIVFGKSSGAMKQIPVAAGTSANSSVMQSGVAILSNPTDGIYVVTLDDVTESGRQFGAVMQNVTFGTSTGTFIPGEDIEVWAVAYDNGRLSNIAESGRVVVNSLFDEMKGLRVGTAALGQNGGGNNNPTQNAAPNPTPVGEVKIPAQYATISSFRHLLNLDGSVSGLDLDNLKTQKSLDNNDRMAAVQVSDLDWSQYMTGVKNIDEVQIYKYKESTAATSAGKYLPVNPSKAENTDIPLQYWGQNHSIKGVDAEGVVLNADKKKDAGLFQKLKYSGANTCQVKSLNLINFKVSGDGSVGALAGYVEGGNLINVAVYNDDTGLTDDSEFEISSSGGSAGGLVGEFSGGSLSGMVSGCGAAVYVKSDNGIAGGLIGTVTSGTVEKSYAGGHTENGRYKLTLKQNGLEGNLADYEPPAGEKDAARLNVQGATVGGLIGTLSGSSSVEGCYTTCSVGGSSKVGGFVGSAEGGATDENCYCTGLVWGTGTKGVFAGSSSIGNDLAGRYLEIVNHIDGKKGTDNNLVPAEPADQMKEVGDAAAGSTDAPYDNASNVSPFDDSASSYNSFVGTLDTPANPYDAKLKAGAEKGLSYVIGGEVQYGFKGIKVTIEPDTDPPATGTSGTDPSGADPSGTSTSGTGTSGAGTSGTERPLLHHGDWPIYETRVFNSIN